MLQYIFHYPNLLFSFLMPFGWWCNKESKCRCTKHLVYAGSATLPSIFSLDPHPRPLPPPPLLLLLLPPPLSSSSPHHLHIDPLSCRLTVGKRKTKFFFSVFPVGLIITLHSHSSQYNTILNFFFHDPLSLSRSNTPTLL